MENSTELAALLNVVIEQNRELVARLDRIEKNQSMSVVKEGYTTAEVAERLKKSLWTISQWCNLGQAKAKKIKGRGDDGEWRIPHEELVRLQADGPLAEGTFQNRRGRSPATVPIQRAS